MSRTVDLPAAAKAQMAETAKAQLAEHAPHVQTEPAPNVIDVTAGGVFSGNSGTDYFVIDFASMQPYNSGPGWMLPSPSLGF